MLYALTENARLQVQVVILAEQALLQHCATSLASFSLYIFIYILYTMLVSMSAYIPEEGIRPIIGGGCELPCGCWELNSGLLEEQSVVLTSEPSLQPSS